MKSEVPER